MPAKQSMKQNEELPVTKIKSEMGWNPPDFVKADVRALQAIERFAETGQNPPTQQDCRRALDWIIGKGASYYGNHFAPGSAGALEYMEGRRAVGYYIVTLLRLRIDAIRWV